MLCRSRVGGEVTLDQIRRETGRERVRLLGVELASHEQLRKGAHEVLDPDQPLHVLMAHPFLKSAERGASARAHPLADNALTPRGEEEP